MEQNNEIDKFIDKLVHEELCNIITTKIAPYTCQLLVRNSHHELIPFASGVMVKLEKFYYILTASHVIVGWSDVNPLFLKINNAYISVVGKGGGTEMGKEQHLDVAYIRLKSEIVPILKQRYRFLTVGKFLHQDKLLLEADYCVFGYPVSIQKKQNGILMPKGAAYFVRPLQDKVFINYNLDFLTHYVLEIKGKAINIKTGTTEKLKIEHYGLSGGGLWYTTIKLSGKKLMSQAYLIGIMTEFRKGKFECLIANRIEILLSSLHQNEGFKLKTKWLKNVL